MKNGKSEILLIITAAVVFIAIIMYIVLDSPEYNSLEPMSVKITQASAAFDESGKINLNTADVSALSALNGIGEKKAQSIVDYRNKNGRFRSVEELTKVSGIGKSILELNRDKITV